MMKRKSNTINCGDELHRYLSKKGIYGTMIPSASCGEFHVWEYDDSRDLQKHIDNYCKTWRLAETVKECLHNLASKGVPPSEIRSLITLMACLNAELGL